MLTKMKRDPLLSGGTSPELVERFATLAVDLRRMALERKAQMTNHRRRCSSEREWIMECCTCRLEGPRCIGHTASIEALAADCEGSTWAMFRNSKMAERAAERFSGISVSCETLDGGWYIRDAPELVIVDNARHIKPEQLETLICDLCGMNLPDNFILFLMQ